MLERNGCFPVFKENIHFFILKSFMYKNSMIRQLVMKKEDNICILKRLLDNQCLEEKQFEI